MLWMRTLGHTVADVGPAKEGAGGAEVAPKREQSLVQKLGNELKQRAYYSYLLYHIYVCALLRQGLLR